MLCWVSIRDYLRLASPSPNELKKRNPVTEKGCREHQHFQHLTADIGHPALTRHLHELIRDGEAVRIRRVGQILRTGQYRVPKAECFDVPSVQWRVACNGLMLGSLSQNTRSGLIHIFPARGLFFAGRLLRGGWGRAPFPARSRSELRNARFLFLNCHAGSMTQTDCQNRGA